MKNILNDLGFFLFERDKYNAQAFMHAILNKLYMPFDKVTNGTDRYLTRKRTVKLFEFF